MLIHAKKTRVGRRQKPETSFLKSSSIGLDVETHPKDEIASRQTSKEEKEVNEASNISVPLQAMRSNGRV